MSMKSGKQQLAPDAAFSQLFDSAHRNKDGVGSSDSCLKVLMKRTCSPAGHSSDSRVL